MVEWIRNAARNNYTRDQIYASLVKYGHTPNDAISALNEAYRGQSESENKMNFKQKKSSFLAVILISTLVIAGIMGAVFWFAPDKPDSEITNGNNSLSEGINDSDGNSSGKLGVNVSAEVTVFSNCGNMICFMQKFSECSPANVSLKLFEDIIYYYEIIGLNQGLCDVKTKFLANPDPSLVNKEMICGYDNSKDFQASIKDMSHCKGQLYELMR